MEPGIKSSFIPHDTAQSSGVQRALSGSFLDILTLISIVLFVASLVLGVGAFLYQQFLETSSKSKVTQLERAKAAFEPALILQLTRLDDRMRDADQILGSHIAPSVFLHMLEQVTLSTVSFRSLDLEAVDPQNITIRMDGVAESVNSVALQADLFSRNGIVTSPIFSNIDRELDGVHFSLSARINPSSILYAQSAGMQTSGTEAATPVSSPAPASSPSPQAQQMQSSAQPPSSSGSGTSFVPVPQQQ